MLELGSEPPVSFPELKLSGTLRHPAVLWATHAGSREPSGSSHGQLEIGHSSIYTMIIGKSHRSGSSPSLLLNIDQHTTDCLFQGLDAPALLHGSCLFKRRMQGVSEESHIFQTAYSYLIREKQVCLPPSPVSSRAL